MLRHTFLVFITLTTIVCVRAVTEKTPTWVPRGTDPPKDINNCRIHYNTLFPWIVGVWYNPLSRFVGMGAMITYISFISTCRQYYGQPTEYKTTGQYIWNFSNVYQPCMQEKPVAEIHKHPSCVKDPRTATFFDFAVFKLTKAFDISGNTYPVAPIPRSVHELWGKLIYFDQAPASIDCIIPSFANQKDKPPKFNFKTFVQAVPFKSQCVEYICEKNPPDPRFTRMCTERFIKRSNCTMLCARYKRAYNIELGADNAYWFAGVPLSCNTTTYGLAAQAKIRKDFPNLPKYDIHFVVTFLRPWIWLNEKINQFEPRWEETNYVENVTNRALSVPNYITDFPATTPYYDDDTALSEAVVQIPSLNELILPLLASFLFARWLQFSFTYHFG